MQLVPRNSCFTISQFVLVLSSIITKITTAIKPITKHPKTRPLPLHQKKTSETKEHVPLINDAPYKKENVFYENVLKFYQSKYPKKLITNDIIINSIKNKFEILKSILLARAQSSFHSNGFF